MGVVCPLNRIAEDGDPTVGNPRDPIPAPAHCVLGSNDVHSRDGTHYRWIVLRWDIEIGGLVAMASADLASEIWAGSIGVATLSHWLPIPTRCGFIGDGSTVQSTPE